MKLNNKVYDVLKYVVMIALPAVSAFYVALEPVWHLPYAKQVAMTIAAVTSLLGSLLGISSASYKKSSTDEEAM